MTDFDELVPRAARGDEAALHAVVEGIRDRIFNLAMRMLGDPEDARDAAQEILIRTITSLASFRGESSFTTWAHSIAVHHLLNVRKKSELERRRTFDAFAEEIDGGIAMFSKFDDTPTDTVLRNEIRASCTHSMLLCLGREERLAYIFGDIFEFRGDVAASILGLPPATFRKRLSRARQRLEAFMKRRCGLYAAANPCRCDGQGAVATGVGALSPTRYRFVALKARPDGAQIGDEHREFLDLLGVAQVMETQPDYVAPEQLIDTLTDIVRRRPS